MEPANPPMTCRTYATRDPREKSAPLAVLLSAMPGLGQIYVGATSHGFINVLVVGAVISVLGAGAGGLEPLLGMFLAFYWLANMVDAGRRAQAYNQQLAGQGSLPVPETGGALLGGLLILFLGLFALLHVTFGLSMAWAERWWPLGLILVGGFLVGQVVAAHRRQRTQPEVSRMDEA